MLLIMFFFCKQKTAYEMRISDWSSDVCSSDLMPLGPQSSTARPSIATLVACRVSQEGVDAISPYRFDVILARLGAGGNRINRGGSHYGAVIKSSLRGAWGGGPCEAWWRGNSEEIGRASCRERVCQYV